MQQTPFFMAGTCVYKGIAETHMFLTKTNNGLIQTFSISFQIF